MTATVVLGAAATRLSISPREIEVDPKLKTMNGSRSKFKKERRSSIKPTKDLFLTALSLAALSVGAWAQTYNFDPFADKGAGAYRRLLVPLL